VLVHGDRTSCISVRRCWALRFPEQACELVIRFFGTFGQFFGTPKVSAEVIEKLEKRGGPSIRGSHRSFRYVVVKIAFGEVATHNHFVLDRGGKVFNRTAPVIKLPAEASEDDHLALLGLLNSSTACFWMKQSCHDKGEHGDWARNRGRSVGKAFLAFNATKLQQFPLPEDRPLELARRLDELARELQATTPERFSRQGAKARRAAAPTRFAPSRLRVRPLPPPVAATNNPRPDDRLAGRTGLGLLSAVRVSQWSVAVVSRQWSVVSCQRPLTPEKIQMTKDNDQDLPAVALGQRAFEIAMARRMAAGELQTTWFDRHGSTPVTELPDHWPADYRQLVERRIELIETDRNIGLIEQPEYKRRWNTEPWESQLERALRDWLLDRLESYFDLDGRMNDRGEVTARGDLHEPRLTSVARLADLARQDADLMQVAELYTGRLDFDVARLVADLVAAESVPALPVLRYKPAAMDKRRAWERTWELQRQEDRRESVVRGPLSVAEDPEPLTTDHGPRTIPVPPKYTSADFQSSVFWRLRGKLDVPKERWTSFPHCEGEDGTPVIAWAGYDHLQLARAVSAYYVEIQEHLGGRDDPRLIPLLAAVIELLPWLRQWHHDLDPDYNQRMDEVFEAFAAEEAKALNLTIDQVRAWQPPKKRKK
jgi:hypothetical protein